MALLRSRTPSLRIRARVRCPPFDAELNNKEYPPAGAAQGSRGGCQEREENRREKVPCKWEHPRRWSGHYLEWICGSGGVHEGNCKGEGGGEDLPCECPGSRVGRGNIPEPVSPEEPGTKCRPVHQAAGGTCSLREYLVLWREGQHCCQGTCPESRIRRYLLRGHGHGISRDPCICPISLYKDNPSWQRLLAGGEQARAA